MYGLDAERVDFVRLRGDDLSAIASIPLIGACDYRRRTVAIGDRYVIVAAGDMLFVDANSFAVTRALMLRSLGSTC
jgi:hypothetical protein